MGNESEILDVVDKSIGSVCQEYRSSPTRFYTENDIVCRLYSMILDGLPESVLNDADSRSQSLIHMEYPTPFKCDMSENNFVVADPESRFHRGHYDLVVLDSKFVKSHTYLEAYGQSFSRCRETIIPWSAANGPFILYGLELMLVRRPLSEIKLTDEWNTWDNEMAKFWQDCEKLRVSKEMGFVREAKGIFFIRERSDKLERYITSKVPTNGVICWGDQLQDRKDLRETERPKLAKS